MLKEMIMMITLTFLVQGCIIINNNPPTPSPEPVPNNNQTNPAPTPMPTPTPIPVLVNQATLNKSSGVCSGECFKPCDDGCEKTWEEVYNPGSLAQCICIAEEVVY